MTTDQMMGVGESRDTKDTYEVGIHTRRAGVMDASCSLSMEWQDTHVYDVRRSNASTPGWDGRRWLSSSRDVKRGLGVSASLSQIRSDEMRLGFWSSTGAEGPFSMPLKVSHHKLGLAGRRARRVRTEEAELKAGPWS